MFKKLMEDQRLDGIPFILETPDPELWPSEVAMLKDWANRK